jgi:hypothetical protein
MEGLQMRRILATLATLVLVSIALVVPAQAANPPNASAQTNGVVRDIAYGPSRTFVVGNFTRARPNGAASGTNEVVRSHVLAMSSKTGALVSSWAPRVNGQVFAVAFSRGRVYIGGSFTSVRGTPRRNLAALSSSTGALIRTWNPGANDVVRALTASPKGGIYVGGAFTRIHGALRQHLALIGTGGIPTRWRPAVGQLGGFGCPPRCSPVVYSIALSSNRTRVYVGGHFGKINGIKRNEAAAITTGGRVLPWNPNIFALKQCGTCTPLETHRVYTIIPTPHRIYMCGGFWKANGTRTTSFNVLVTNTSTGKPVPGFGIGTNGDTPGCALRGDILYLGGHFTYAGRACSQRPPAGQTPKSCDASNSTRRLHVLAVNVQTNKILSFNPTPNTASGVWVVTAGPPGVTFGGYFTRFGGQDHQGIARYRGNPAA